MKSSAITLAVVVALHATPGIAADASTELEELIVTARRILTPGLGVESLDADQIARRRARSSDTASLLTGIPGVSVTARRRVEPARHPRPRRRSPAHAGRRCRHYRRLPEPHESATLLHRPLRRRPSGMCSRRHAGQRRRRQHRRHHPRAFRRSRVRAGRGGQPARGRSGRVLPQQRRRLGRQPRRDLRDRTPELRLHRRLCEVRQLRGRRRLQGLHVHRARGAHPAHRRGRLDGLREPTTWCGSRGATASSCSTSATATRTSPSSCTRTSAWT